jgi:hypothetical protein
MTTLCALPPAVVAAGTDMSISEPVIATDNTDYVDTVAVDDVVLSSSPAYAAATGKTVPLASSVAVAAAKIRYSRVSIGKEFGTGQPVATWLNELPYTTPIEVIPIDDHDLTGEYLSMDNRRLFSARNYGGDDAMTECIVYDPRNAVTPLMTDYGRDILLVGWLQHETFHRVTVRAKNLRAVFLIGCCQQSSSFPLGGTHTTPALGRKPYDINQFMLNGPITYINGFTICQEECRASLFGDTVVYVSPRTDINMLHSRADMPRYILNAELFEVMEHHTASHIQPQLRARANIDDLESDE